MKVGDLVRFSGGLPASGIVLQTKPDGDVFKGRRTSHSRVKVYWIVDAESSWEPAKWLEVISANGDKIS